MCGQSHDNNTSASCQHIVAGKWEMCICTPKLKDCASCFYCEVDFIWQSVRLGLDHLSHIISFYHLHQHYLKVSASGSICSSSIMQICILQHKHHQYYLVARNLWWCLSQASLLDGAVTDSEPPRWTVNAKLTWIVSNGFWDVSEESPQPTPVLHLADCQTTRTENKQTN